MSGIKHKLNDLAKETRDNYNSSTIQGLNERVTKLEKELADLKKFIHNERYMKWNVFGKDLIKGKE